MKLEPALWKDRRVLLTGHTGFKGAWLALWLERLGAHVTGLSLPPESPDGAFARLSPVESRSRIGDIRAAELVSEVMADAAPSVVMHLAAEAIVRRAYREPSATFATNVMGTVNILEAERSCDDVEAVPVVTSDKVYEDATANRQEKRIRSVTSTPTAAPRPAWSSSRGPGVRATSLWMVEPWSQRGQATSSGAGDAAPDRLVPDVLRAHVAGQPVVVRNPRSVRPWQHVLDPLHGYLRWFNDSSGARRGNHTRSASVRMICPGPCSMSSRVPIRRLAAVRWRSAPTGVPRRRRRCCSTRTSRSPTLGWRPVLSTEEALEWTADWHVTLRSGGHLRAMALEQITKFEAMASDSLG